MHYCYQKNSHKPVKLSEGTSAHLHVACCQAVKSDDKKEEIGQIVHDLIRLYPGGAQIFDRDGNLPLHLACKYGQNDNVVKFLLLSYPGGVWVKDKNGRLPLHLICKAGFQSMSSVNIVQSLLTIHPAAIYVKERQYGCTPVHFASFRNAFVTRTTLQYHEQVLISLLDGAEDAALSTDSKTFIPLHVACRSGASYKIINTLININPESVECKDQNGRLPLHWALHKSTSELVIEALLDAYPDGASVTEDKYGMLPVHVACRVGLSTGIIGMLLGHYREGASTFDDNGDLPIHIACRNSNISMGSIISLLLAEPNTVNIRNSNGKTPLHLAKSQEDPNQAIISALQRHPSSFSWFKNSSMRRESDFNFFGSSGRLEPRRCINYQKNLSPETRHRKLKSCNVSCHTGEKSYHIDKCLDEEDNELQRRILTCVICLAKPVTHILYPCGHACLCDECAEKGRLEQLHHTCPIGRCEFIDTIRIYGRVIEES